MREKVGNIASRQPDIVEEMFNILSGRGIFSYGIIDSVEKLKCTEVSEVR